MDPCNPLFRLSLYTVSEKLLYLGNSYKHDEVMFARSLVRVYACITDERMVLLFKRSSIEDVNEMTSSLLAFYLECM